MLDGIRVPAEVVIGVADRVLCRGRSVGVAHLVVEDQTLPTAVEGLRVVADQDDCPGDLVEHTGFAVAVALGPEWREGLYVVIEGGSAPVRQVGHVGEAMMEPGLAERVASVTEKVQRTFEVLRRRLRVVELRVGHAQTARGVRLADGIAELPCRFQCHAIDLQEVVPESEPVEVDVQGRGGAASVFVVAVGGGVFDDRAQDVPLRTQSTA